MGRGSITYYALRAKVKGLNQRSWSGRKEEGGETVRYLLKKKIMTVEECCWIKPATIGSSLYLNSILAYFHNIELLEAFYFASNNIGPTNIILLHHRSEIRRLRSMNRPRVLYEIFFLQNFMEIPTIE